MHGWSVAAARTHARSLTHSRCQCAVTDEYINNMSLQLLTSTTYVVARRDASTNGRGTRACGRVREGGMHACHAWLVRACRRAGGPGTCIHLFHHFNRPLTGTECNPDAAYSRMVPHAPLPTYGVVELVQFVCSRFVDVDHCQCLTGDLCTCMSAARRATRAHASTPRAQTSALRRQQCRDRWGGADMGRRAA